MKKYINRFFLLLLLFTLEIDAQVSDAVIDDPGDIAFVAYHDTDDGFSFVLLDDCPSATSIRFIDEEWNGTSFGTGEGDVLWTNNTGGVIVKGTVINITDADDNDAGISASTGVATEEDLGFATAASLATEQIYAITGTRSTPGIFLTFIGSTSNASLANTGLTLGNNAVQITGEGYYSGSTTCNGTIEDCSSMLNNSNNWTVSEFDFPSSVVSGINLGGVLSIDSREIIDILFVNPVENETFEVFSKKSIDNISIYTISGVLVVTSNNNKVNVANLEPGIYLAKIIAQENIVTKKVVIK